MTVSGLDLPCGACGRVSGDHLLREWAACLGTTTTHLPYADQAPDTAQLAADAVRRRFLLADDLIIADHFTVRAATLAGSTGVVQIKTPILLHEFQIGRPGEPPATVAKVGFLASPDGMRAFGRLVRDSANGAANGAER